LDEVISVFVTSAVTTPFFIDILTGTGIEADEFSRIGGDVFAPVGPLNASITIANTKKQIEMNPNTANDFVINELSDFLGICDSGRACAGVLPETIADGFKFTPQ
jgi:hypothetical protein